MNLGGLLVGIHGLFSKRNCCLVRRITCGYPWPELEGKRIWYDPRAIEVVCLVFEWLIGLTCMYCIWHGKVGGFTCMYCVRHVKGHRVLVMKDRMDRNGPNTSIGRLCLGENNQGSVAEGIENKEQWEGPEFQDTASSGQEKEAKVFTFYKMEEEGERYFTPCYVGRLHAYVGEINIKYEKNLISNEFAVKLCLEYEEKIGVKLVKRELLVSLKGEFYFVKFIVNPEEDDVEPNVILGRSFMRLAKGISDFGNGVITIHPELDPFLDNSEETEKFEDDWDHLLDIDFGDIPEINEAGVPPFVCKMGKSERNKKRALENFQLYYYDVGPSLFNGKPLTQEAAQEALVIDICKRFFILEEERHVIETMAYSDKNKKILDEEIKKEEEEAIKQVKGEALQEKEDPGAFIIPI
ncbi:hypothetical protein Tco_1318249 [Tanacetum coccineum]